MVPCRRPILSFPAWRQIVAVKHGFCIFHVVRDLGLELANLRLPCVSQRASVNRRLLFNFFRPLQSSQLYHRLNLFFHQSQRCQ